MFKTVSGIRGDIELKNTASAYLKNKGEKIWRNYILRCWGQNVLLNLALYLNSLKYLYMQMSVLQEVGIFKWI